MEEYWKEDALPAYRTCWLVLIRIAVCQYHSRRGNWGGAIKLMSKAATEAEPALFDRLGVDGGQLAELLKRTALEWSGPGAAYRDIDLPIRDERLLAAARRRCAELGYTWGLPGAKERGYHPPASDARSGGSRRRAGGVGKAQGAQSRASRAW